MARSHIEKRPHADGTASYRVKVELPPDPITGKRRTKTGTFPTKHLAEKTATQWASEADNGIVVMNTKATLADICGQWLDVKRPDLKPRSFLHYEATVKTITDKIGTLPVQRVQPANIDALYALMRVAVRVRMQYIACICASHKSSITLRSDASLRGIRCMR